jgi:DNA-binding beta-propeller fold protein YncE
VGPARLSWAYPYSSSAEAVQTAMQLITLQGHYILCNAIIATALALQCRGRTEPRRRGEAEQLPWTEISADDANWQSSLPLRHGQRLYVTLVSVSTRDMKPVHRHSAFSASAIAKSRFGHAFLALLLLWHALLGAAVEAPCNAGSYATLADTCAPCQAGFFCASGSFNARGAVDGQGMIAFTLTIVCTSSLFRFALLDVVTPWLAFRDHTVLVGTLSLSASDGVGVQTKFATYGMALSRSGAFAVASHDNRIRIIDLATTQVTTLAGSGDDAFADGQGTHASFNRAEGVAITPDNAFVLVGEGSATTSHRIRHIEIATGIVTTLAGNGVGYLDGVGTLAKFNEPRCIAMYPNGLYLLISDQKNMRIRRLDLATRAVTTVAGSYSGFADGIGTNAQFSWQYAIAIDPTGSVALICDYFNNRIRHLDLASMQVTTLAGSGAFGFQNGASIGAKFTWPVGISIDPTGSFALVADSYQYIRRIDIATAQVTILAGTGVASAVDGVGAQATFNSVHSISIDASGTFALASDVGNNRFRRIALSSAPCSAGYYCPTGSSSATQATCGAGTLCAAVSGLSAPTLCKAGYFCASGSFNSRGAVDGQGMTLVSSSFWFYSVIFDV